MRDTILNGISKFDKTDVATLPRDPKIEINTTPISPQHTPATTPMIEPNNPVLSFFVLA